MAGIDTETLNVGVTIDEANMAFTKDGAVVKVAEDTVDPANNIPLPSKVFVQKDGADVPVNKDTVTASNTIGIPVEIVGADGAVITITAGDINVQTSHTGANFDSLRVGDGTNIMAVNADLEATVHDAKLNTATGAIDDSAVTDPALDSSVISALKGILTGINVGNAKKPNVLLSALCGIITPAGLTLGTLATEGGQINIGNNGDNLAVECDGNVVAVSVAGQAITLNVTCPVGDVVVKSLIGSDISADSVAITITE